MYLNGQYQIKTCAFINVVIFVYNLQCCQKQLAIDSSQSIQVQRVLNFHNNFFGDPFNHKQYVNSVMFTIVWILDIFGTDLCDSRGHLVFQKMFCTSFISYCTYIRKEVDQDQINVLTIKLLFLNEAGASRLTPSMMRRTNCSSSL